jgi:hypothetical protein
MYGAHGEDYNRFTLCALCKIAVSSVVTFFPGLFRACPKTN